MRLPGRAFPWQQESERNVFEMRFSYPMSQIPYTYFSFFLFLFPIFVGEMTYYFATGKIGWKRTLHLSCLLVKSKGFIVKMKQPSKSCSFGGTEVFAGPYKWILQMTSWIMPYFFTVEKNKDYSDRDQVAIKINRDSNIFDAVRACLFTYQLVMFRSIDICFTCYIRPNFVLWKYATTVIINTTSNSSVKHIFCTVTLLCSITSSCIDASYFYASCHLHWTQVGVMYRPIVMITSLLEWVNK